MYVHGLVEVGGIWLKSVEVGVDSNVEHRATCSRKTTFQFSSSHLYNAFTTAHRGAWHSSMNKHLKFVTGKPSPGYITQSEGGP